MATQIFDFTETTNTPGYSRPEPWVNKLAKFFSSLFDIQDGRHPAPILDGSQDSTRGVGGQATNANGLPTLWKHYESRKSIWQDINRMDDEDEIVSQGLDIIADCTINFDLTDDVGFRVVANGADDDPQRAKIQDIIDQLIRRIKLNDEVWQIARATFKYGGEFREVLIDREANRIVGLKQCVQYHIWPKENKKGDKLPGWVYKTDKDVYNQTQTFLEEWQIAPFYFGNMRGLIPTPRLASARRGWEKLQLAEDGLTTARWMRAYDKLVHKVPVEKNWSREMIQSTLERYKDRILRKEQQGADTLMSKTPSPTAAQTDFFIPDDGSNRGGVELLSANNNQLANLTDIYYARERLICRLGVPMDYLQVVSSMKTHMGKASGVNDIHIQFVRTLKRLQSALRVGISRIIDMELLLNGIPTGDDVYAVKFGEIDGKSMTDDADVEFTLAQAAVYFVEAFGALPPELMASKFLRLTDDEQKMMKKFLDTDANKIFKAQVKAIENEAIVPSPGLKPNAGSGSGNNNKSKVARSTEQQNAAQRRAAGTRREPTYKMSQVIDLFLNISQGILNPNTNEEWTADDIEAGLLALQQ
jgi:Bacteriophage T4-like portal protein (Gp20)